MTDPAWDAIASAATDYLVGSKSWSPDEYRLEYRGLTGDGKLAIVHAIHADDERNPRPGGGRSLELRIDPVTHAIVRELGFQ